MRGKIKGKGKGNHGGAALLHLQEVRAVRPKKAPHTRVGGHLPTPPRRAPGGVSKQNDGLPVAQRQAVEEGGIGTLLLKRNEIGADERKNG